MSDDSSPFLRAQTEPGLDPETFSAHKHVTISISGFCLSIPSPFDLKNSMNGDVN
jgi:hypothetical protein